MFQKRKKRNKEYMQGHMNMSDEKKLKRKEHMRNYFKVRKNYKLNN